MRGPMLCDSGRDRFDDVARRSSCSQHVRPFLAVSGDGEVTGALWEICNGTHTRAHSTVCVHVCMCLLHPVWATLGQGVRKCVVKCPPDTSTSCGQPSMCLMRSVISGAAHGGINTGEIDTVNTYVGCRYCTVCAKKLKKS